MIIQNAPKEHILFCDLSHINHKIAIDSFPYGIACVASFLKVNCSFPVEVHIIKFPEDIYDTILKYNPRIIAFSNYVWNSNLAYKFATIIKQQYPRSIIIFGGPNFPAEKEEQEVFLRERCAIDFYIEGEGEKPFLNLVYNLLDAGLNLDEVRHRSLYNVRTIYNENFIAYDMLPRIGDLKIIPSPYLIGILDSFFKRKLVPLVQFTRGCPFTCTYCFAGTKYNNIITRPKIYNMVQEELEYIAKRIKLNKTLLIADSNFGMYKRDIVTAQIIAEIYEKTGYPSHLHVSSGKNQLNRVLKVTEILKGRLRVTGSVQSTDHKVLENIKRKNIDIDQIYAFAEITKKTNANSYSEIIIGLPGDSWKTFLQTIKDIIEADFSHVVLYTLMLLHGTTVASKQSVITYGLIRKYRIPPLCFGEYRFGKKKFNSAEIEAVCVGNNTLSFSEYIECRVFSFIVAVFYNDRVFGELVDFLKYFKVSVFEWLVDVYKRYKCLEGLFKGICKDFESDTKNELWDSVEEQYSFINSNAFHEKLASEELGRNLIFCYRAYALISAFQQINEIAFMSARHLIGNSNKLSSRMDRFLDDFQEFNLERKIELLNTKRNSVKTFNYNLYRILDSRKKLNWDDIIDDCGSYTFNFYHTEGQKEEIAYAIEAYGPDIDGFAKALSRLPIENLYRSVEYCHKHHGGVRLV